MENQKWERFTPDEAGQKLGEGICPHCKQATIEKLYKEEDGEKVAVKERCSNGCYVYNFETGKREK